MVKNGENNKKKKSPRKRGRPNKKHQQQIKEDIWPFFAAGYSAYYAAEKTGYDWKTVRSYFKDWEEEFLEDMDVLEMQKTSKMNLIRLLDKRKEVFEEQLERFLKTQRIIEKYEATPDDPLASLNLSLESHITNVNKKLTELEMDKAAILITPTGDLKLTKILKDKYGIDLEEMAKKQKAKMKQDAV